MNKSKLLKVSALAFVLSLSAGLCSAFTETKVSANTPAPTSEIIGKNLSLDDNIYVLYAVDFQNTLETDETGVLVWTAPQETYDYQTANTVLYSTGTMTDDDGVTYPTFSYNKLSAKQMTEVVFASSYVERDGVYYYGEVEKYSILEYAYNKLGKTEKTETDDEDLKTLLTAMLNYGAAAQIYKDYNLDKLATDDFTYVRIENATFEDGFNYGLFEAGDEVKFTVKEGYTIDTTLTDYITKNENGEYILTVPSEKTEIPTKPQEHVHDWSEWTVVSEETCTTSGLEMRICQTDASHSEQRFIQPKHILTYHEGQEATCEHPGWKDYQDCSRCGYTNYEEIPALGHDFSNGHCCGIGLEFNLLENNTYKVVGIGSYPNSNLIISNRYNGKPVTVIGESAFYDNDNITSVIIGDSITSIEGFAFESCDNLTNVTIGNSVKAIEWFAFEGCSNLSNIKLGDSVVSIGHDAFSNCINLTEITIPNSVTEIGSSFCDCKKLTSITIGNSVTYIADYAFLNCDNLTSAIFKNPNSWTINKETIPADDLANPTTAASYLTIWYTSYSWKRTD